MLETVKYGSDVAIQVVGNGSRFEMFLVFRDRLRIDSRLLQSYNELKLESIGLDEDLYRERKSAFIEKTLSSAATRPNMNVPRAVVFDMDGLLLDTEKQALEGFLHACSIHGVTPHLPTYYRCIGRSRDTRQILIDGHAPGFPFDDVAKEWNAYYAANFKNRPRPVKAGAREILETVYKAGLPCALATSTREPGATERLSAVDFDRYFDVMVTGDRIERGKPRPRDLPCRGRRTRYRPSTLLGVGGLRQRCALGAWRRILGAADSGSRRTGRRRPVAWACHSSFAAGRQRTPPGRTGAIVANEAALT